MKRKLLLLLLGAILLLTGCAPQPATDAADKPAMYIEPAQLTEQEELIKALASQGRSCLLYYFQLGKDEHSVTICVYHLENGQWALYTGGNQLYLPSQEGKGRFALSFGPLTEGIITSTVDERNGIGSLRQAPAEIVYDIAGLNTETAASTALAEIRYDEELPLALQFITSKLHEVEPSPVLSFHPEDLAMLGHEHVFLVTATFSKTTHE